MKFPDLNAYKLSKSRFGNSSAWPSKKIFRDLVFLVALTCNLVIATDAKFQEIENNH